MTTPEYPNSPSWSSNNKRLVLFILLSLLLLGIYRIRALILPLLTAVVLAYLVEPVVRYINKRTPLGRGLSLVIVYLLIVAALVSIPVSVITPIVNQATSLVNNIPRYLRQLGEILQEPIIIGGFELPLDSFQIDQIYTTIASNLIGIIQTMGGQSLGLLGSVATATLSTVGWTLLVLFLSFYLVKDHEQLYQAVVNLVPPDYQADFRHLIGETQLLWDAFLRGQLVLCLVVGGIVFALALILDLPNALALAIIAGIAEFLPTIGPVIAAVPAVLVALFQSQASWLGSLMSPFWFAMLLAGIYTLIYQLENYYLVPRIIGRHLRLHPLVVIMGALAGASVAGLLGILLAAPLLATARLVLKYLYAKLTDQSIELEATKAAIEEDDDNDDSTATEKGPENE